MNCIGVKYLKMVVIVGLNVRLVWKCYMIFNDIFIGINKNILFREYN